MRAYLNKLLRAASGFTLIETLVAVLILATAIAGPLTIASRGLTTALIAKDQTIAYYLAQDAVEYVRYARDSNRLQSTNWLTAGGSGATDLAPCISSNGTVSCYFDSLGNNPSAPAACAGGVCPVLYFDPNNNDFTYSQSAPNTRTIFYRTVTITSPVASNADEASLAVTISWCDQACTAAAPHTITVRENLLNWQ